MREEAIVSWSGGKDCVLALYEVVEEYDIVALLTTATSEYKPISRYGVRTRLLEAQAMLGVVNEYPLHQTLTILDPQQVLASQPPTP